MGHLSPPICVYMREKEFSNFGMVGLRTAALSEPTSDLISHDFRMNVYFPRESKNIAVEEKWPVQSNKVVEQSSREAKVVGRKTCGAFPFIHLSSCLLVPIAQFRINYRFVTAMTLQHMLDLVTEGKPELVDSVVAERHSNDGRLVVQPKTGTVYLFRGKRFDNQISDAALQ